MGALTGPAGAAAGRHSDDAARWLRIDDAAMPGAARRVATELATGLGFPAARVGEVGIAVTEAATNLWKYARDGALMLGRTRVGGVAGLELVAVDSGPGMADLAAATRDGHSSGGTLGIGLGAITRLSSAHDMFSEPGRGTVLTVTFWPAAGVSAPAAVGGITRAMPGEETCGDAWAFRTAGDRTMAMLCDGLGHGPLAARASAEAVRAFLADGGDSPAEAMRRLHGALSGSRGAAVAVICLDRGAGVVRHTGVGNIAAYVVAGGKRSPLLSFPGIVGHQARTIRETSHPLGPDDVVVLHSDGLTERWSLADYPGLGRRAPVLIAATLLRDAGLRRDDASVLVGCRAPARRPA